MAPDSADRTQRAIEEAQARLAELVAKIDRDTLGEAFLREVRFGLRDLRRFIEDPAEDRVSWDFPFVELTYPVPWDFSSPDQMPLATKGLEVVGGFTPEDVVDGKVPEDLIFACLVEAEATLALGQMTHGIVEVRDAAKIDPNGPPAYLMPRGLVDSLDKVTDTRATPTGVEGTPEGVEMRARFVDELAAPFSLGPYEAEALVAEATAEAAEVANYTEEERAELLKGARDLTDEEWAAVEESNAAFAELRNERPDVPPLMFTVTSSSHGPIAGSVLALVYPLVVDVDKRRAWFPVGVGLTFTEGHPRDLSAEDLADFWDLLTRLDGPLAPKDLAQQSETPERSTKATGPQAGPPQDKVLQAGREAQKLVLQDSRVRYDPLALKTVGFLRDVKPWRKSSAVKRWDDLVAEEVESILERHGEAAFVAEPGIRGPLLRHRYTAAGEELVELTKEAEGDLLAMVGAKSFFRTKRDPDGVSREYWTRRVSAGRGTITIGLVLYGKAHLLSPAAREAEISRLTEERDQDAAALFHKSEEERRKLDEDLAVLRAIDDGFKIAPRLLTALYQQRTNPLRLSARELYLALQCEGDPHRFARVKAALEALRRFEYEYEGEGLGPDLSGRVRGSFVTEWGHGEGRGPGAHRDVYFHIMLSTWAIGSLLVFKQTNVKLKDPRSVFFDWSAKLDKKDRDRLDYVQGFSALASYYDTAAGLTPAQSRLRTWIEHEITRREDGTAKGREAHRVRSSASDASEPRVYGADFCPLLDQGAHYHGALGHFPHRRNAETGRKLKGRSQSKTKTGGPRAGGLLETLGYDLPPGGASQAREAVAVAALKDLRAVVEEYLGGRVVGRRNGVWLSLLEAERIRAEELLGEVSWHLFLPEDWMTRRQRIFEDHQERRGYPVQIDTNLTNTDKVGLAETELRVRLHAARQERKLTTADVGLVFGVSKMTVSKWERGRDNGGAQIPADLQPLVLRWIDTGDGPTEAELVALAARRRGGKRAAS